MVVFSMILCVIEVSAVKKFDFKMCELSRQVIIGDNNDMLISIIGESAFAIYILVEKDKIPQFRKAFKEANNKYKEWIVVAQQNNVTDLSKEMSLVNKFPSVKIVYRFYDADYFTLEYNLVPSVLFTVDKKRLYFIRNKEVESQRINEYNIIESRTETTLFSFESVSESNELQRILFEELDKIEKENKRLNELFK